MAGGDKRRLDSQVDRRVAILEAIDDQRVVTAHLQRQDLLRLPRQLAMQVIAGAGAAGEQQAVDIRTGRQRFAGFPAALHQIDHPVRQAGLLPQLQGFLGGQRRQLARFEHHAVSGQQRRHDMAVRQMAGEVVRPKHRQHAVRAMTQHRSAVGHRRLAKTGARLVGLQRNAHFTDHRLNFGQRFPTRFTGLTADGFRQRLFVLFQQGGEAFHQLFALFKRRTRPGGKRGTRGLAGGGDVVSIGGVSAPQRLVADRIGFAELGAAALPPDAINQQSRMGHHAFSCAIRGAPAPGCPARRPAPQRWRR